MMLMILAGLQGLDTSVSEAARMDGASKLQEIFYIKIPGIKTGSVDSIVSENYRCGKDF